MAAPTPATKTKVVRVSVYIRRKAGMSQEEFNHYWSHVHGPVVRPLLEKMGFLKYTQVSDAPWHSHFAPQSPGKQYYSLSYC